ncbi:MAG: helix-turn-helix transcriptional regulator [Chloroflexi bacterium]|nr:helix-turn-helix transcriptional regulator [Chloroflexota bacterium]
MTATNRLGKRIKARRQELNMTQVQLAEVSGITQGHISQLEKGERGPTLATLRKLRSALAVEDSEFLMWLDVA